MSGFLSRWSGLTLRSRILLMILPVSLLSMTAAALVAYISARDALTVQATDQLTAIRSAKKAQVESYFRTLTSTFGAFSEDVGVAAAAQFLIDGFNQLGREKLDSNRAKALETYYRETFVPELNKTPGFEKTSADDLLPRTDRSIEAQSLFIVENPHKAGERAKLLDHPVANPYTLAHYTYHGWLRGLADRLKLYDLFVVSESGWVVYTAAKELDFATNLVEGPYATTNIGRLFRQVLSEHRKGHVKLSDFAFYAPSGGEPAMFIATPVYAGHKLVAVLIGQVSTSELSRTMNGDKSWQTDGLGTTGFAYITDSSKLLRNDHRAFVERPEAFFKNASSIGYSDAEIDAMRRQKTTVLRYKMDIEGVNKALGGETVVVSAVNTLGHEALQAVTPLTIPDLSWVLGVHIEQSEIHAPLQRLKRTMLTIAAILTLLSTLFAMWVAARFVRPMHALMKGIEAIKAGQRDVKIVKSGDDEFGRLTDSFNTMATAINERDDIIAGKNKAYSGLLNRVFPEVVADRMRKGEAQIVDTLPNVTIIYASIFGFTRATDTLSGDASMELLNEIIDDFDTVAERNGVDRVKTFGEHYIAACGLGTPRLDHAARAVDFGDALAGEVRRLNAERGVKLGLRVSIASGKVHAGLVGNRRFVYDVWGLPLNLVRRLIHDATENEMLITEQTYQQLPPDNGFVERPPVHSLSLGAIACLRRALPNQLDSAGRLGEPH
jgi:class 3 adenylate cyclase/HAMP domain-containing protein